MHGVSQQSLARFATRAQKLAGVSGDVAVLITGSREIQQLNRRFRGKNKPTDVLSFPREEGGDIAICADIAQTNADRFGHPALSEIKVLILHGMLHLAGYDHETDNGRMEEKETQLRARLKLPASLIQRTQSLATKPAGAKTKSPRRSGVKKQSGLSTSLRRPRSIAGAKRKKGIRA